MDETLSLIDIFIGISFLAAFVMGVAGRGFLSVSLSLAFVALSLGAAYLLSGELSSRGLLSPVGAGAAVFAGAFALLSALLWAVKRISGAAFIILDGFVSALLAAAGAAFIIAGAERWMDIHTGDSAIYPRAVELWRANSPGAKEKINEKAEKKVKIPDKLRP